MKISQRLVILVLCTMTLTAEVSALQIEMLSDTISLPHQRQQTLGIINNTESTVATEVQVVTRRHALDGREHHDGNAENILVMPPQMVLNPGEEQIVTLRWMGPITLKKELPFRIIVKDLPVNFSENPEEQKSRAGQVRLLYQVIKSFYVSPPKVAADIRLESVQRVGDKTQSNLAVTLANRGTQHQIIRSFTLSLGPQAIAVQFGRDILDGGANLLGGESRQFIVPIPPGLSADLQPAKLLEFHDI